jgi:hypothetical protein
MMNLLLVMTAIGMLGWSRAWLTQTTCLSLYTSRLRLPDRRTFFLFITVLAAFVDHHSSRELLEILLQSSKLEGVLGLSTMYVGGEYEKTNVATCSAEFMYTEDSLKSVFSALRRSCAECADGAVSADITEFLAIKDHLPKTRPRLPTSHWRTPRTMVLTRA